MHVLWFWSESIEKMSLCQSYMYLTGLFFILVGTPYALLNVVYCEEAVFSVEMTPLNIWTAGFSAQLAFGEFKTLSIQTKCRSS